MKRKLFIASSVSAVLAGCGAVGSKLNDSSAVRAVLKSAEDANFALIGTHGLAREYPSADISADFPMNSFDTPSDATYMRLVHGLFSPYRLVVDGDVAHPQMFSLAHLRALPQTAQITRHDCVEGWSAVAQWSGVALRDIIALVQPRPTAAYLVFHTFDRDADGVPYYESLNMQQALHPQALLALQQNGTAIPPGRGAPVRLKVPTQLGYKSAKWVRHVEFVASLAPIFGGKGGYWEDQGYEWYAGI